MNDILNSEQPPVDYEPEKFVFQRPLCAFTGHRPNNLGYDGENDPEALKMRAKIGEAVRQAYDDGYRDFISGMAIGIDMWAALEVLLLRKEKNNIRLYAAVPFPQQSNRWFGWQQEMYTDMLRLCERIFISCNHPSKQAPVIRDAFMVKNAGRLIAVYNGAKGGTAITVKMAERKKIEIVNLYCN